MKKLTTLVTTILLTVITGCSNLVLKPADFSWPVETVLKVDKNGFVQEKRYNLSFNTKELFYNETGDSLGFQGKELRVIRNTKGYYFMVADNFRNIYIFQPGESSLTLSNKINLSDSVGVSNPAFNLRPPYIELNYDNNKKLYLSNEGKKEEDEK